MSEPEKSRIVVVLGKEGRPQCFITKLDLPTLTSKIEETDAYVFDLTPALIQPEKNLFGTLLAETRATSLYRKAIRALHDLEFYFSEMTPTIRKEVFSLTSNRLTCIVEGLTIRDAGLKAGMPETSTTNDEITSI